MHIIRSNWEATSPVSTPFFYSPFRCYRNPSFLFFSVGNQRRGWNARVFIFAHTSPPCIITFRRLLRRDSPRDSPSLHRQKKNTPPDIFFITRCHESLIHKSREREILTSCHDFDLTKLLFFLLSFVCLPSLFLWLFELAVHSTHETTADFRGLVEGALSPKVIFLLMRILFNFRNWLLSYSVRVRGRRRMPWGREVVVDIKTLLSTLFCVGPFFARLAQSCLSSLIYFIRFALNSFPLFDISGLLFRLRPLDCVALPTKTL